MDFLSFCRLIFFIIFFGYICGYCQAERRSRDLSPAEPTRSPSPSFHFLHLPSPASTQHFYVSSISTSFTFLHLPLHLHFSKRYVRMRNSSTSFSSRAFLFVILQVFIIIIYIYKFITQWHSKLKDALLWNGALIYNGVRMACKLFYNGVKLEDLTNTRKLALQRTPFSVFSLLFFHNQKIYI
jgi:hypothetical protein